MPEHVTDIFGKVIPIARVIVESEVASVRSDMSAISRLSRQEKRVQIKARMIEDGPSRRQGFVIASLWIGRRNWRFYALIAIILSEFILPMPDPF